MMFFKVIDHAQWFHHPHRHYPLYRLNSVPTIAVLASVTEHALCGVTTGITCEECQNSFFSMSRGQQTQERNVNIANANTANTNITCSIHRR